MTGKVPVHEGFTYDMMRTTAPGAQGLQVGWSNRENIKRQVVCRLRQEVQRVLLRFIVLNEQAVEARARLTLADEAGCG